VTDPKVVQPGGSLGLDLTLKDGEEVLIIKRTPSGVIEFPMFGTKVELTGPEITSAIAQLCRDAIAQIEATRN
jgi:hypothetical protein